MHCLGYCIVEIFSASAIPAHVLADVTSDFFFPLWLIQNGAKAAAVFIVLFYYFSAYGRPRWTESVIITSPCAPQGVPFYGGGVGGGRTGLYEDLVKS